MALSKVVRKGSYQGVAQWGISTSSEITPSRKTARKWADLENARNPKRVHKLWCDTRSGIWFVMLEVIGTGEWTRVFSATTKDTCQSWMRDNPLTN